MVKLCTRGMCKKAAHIRSLLGLQQYPRPPRKAEIKHVWMSLLNLDLGLESWHLEVGFEKSFSGLGSAGVFL